MYNMDIVYLDMKENEIRPDSMYNSDGLADALGMNRRVITNKANAGEIPGYKVFGKWFFKGSDIIDFIEKNGITKSSK